MKSTSKNFKVFFKNGGVILIAMLALARTAVAGYVEEVLADNPIAYWRFEETTGTMASDSSGGNNGTYNNVALGQPSAFGSIGNAAGFNGTSSFVSVPALGAVTDLTIEAWVNANTFPTDNWASLYNTEAFNPASNWSHWQFVNGAYGSGTRFEWALGFSDMGNSTTFDTSTWYHIVTTYKQSTGEAKLYVNGVFKENLYEVSGITTNLTAANIGSWLPSESTPFYKRLFDGRIDEVAVYNSTLSAERILTHFNAANTINISIDIKLGGKGNNVSLKGKGKIGVALLSTDTFDAATSVDTSTVHFGTAAVVNATIKDVNGDGRPDIVLYFNTADVGIACGDTSATLTGATLSGQLFQGSDTIKISGCK